LPGDQTPEWWLPQRFGHYSVLSDAGRQDAYEWKEKERIKKALKARNRRAKMKEKEKAEPKAGLSGEAKVAADLAAKHRKLAEDAAERQRKKASKAGLPGLGAAAFGA